MKLLILFFSVFIMMQDQPCAEIKLEVTNVKNSQGVVRVLLFDGENGFPNDPKKAFKSASGEIINNKVTFTFKGIPKGAYAISVFHDSQNLGYLRTNILGIPKDDYGFSNNASGHFGPPSFEKAKFSVDKQKVEVRIRF
ncbi:hypothetical protein P872_15250 [Rhodonellum psychrophilum GCM71 = DSM 17998]|uniref:DUF2141 domain-containing protein n=2 Tax=Rhodonellum TaxID=336827 RepID=U5C237_9BACT|nr:MULTISPECIES: DUF2141 domain-containing protein [Rhodonellum]ERM84138.1 hypothetical protein P872_15250 [Rhodonellum psychrophilum GCM71 = DSM 17998]SDZ20307.1 Uncharacterized conserved protein, DUF2141 family [Rhodonellum ikkaensis]